MTDWNPRLDLVEAMEGAGWIGDADLPLSILRKDGATLGVTGEGDVSLTGPGGWTATFPTDAPNVVIVAAALAACTA